MNSQVTKEDKNKKIVLDFIKKNPGRSYQDIVNHFDEKNKFSRVTVYKIIKKLSEDNLIIISNNKDNRQTKSIFVNDESFLYQNTEEISSLSNAFSSISSSLNKTVSGINYKYNKYLSIENHHDPEQNRKITTAGYSVRFLLDIFNMLQKIYNYKILTEAEEKKIDEIAKQKVLDFFHFKFSKILLEIGDTNRMFLNILSHLHEYDKKQNEEFITNLKHHMFSNFFLYLNNDHGSVVEGTEAYYFLQACETHGLGQETSIIFNFIWNELYNKTETKNWRDIFYDYESTSNRYVLKNNKKPEKI